MKVAILISGRLSCEQTCLIPKILNSVAKVHVFASLNEPVEKLEEYKKRLEKINATVRCEPYTVPKEYINHPKNRLRGNAQRMMSMYYHNMKAFEMIGDEHFDVVIKYRPDFLTESLPSLDFPIKPNHVYIPAGEDHYGLNDRLAVGDKETMKKYCNIYNDIDTALNTDPFYILHPEPILLYHLPKMVTIERFRYDCSLDPLRQTS